MTHREHCNVCNEVVELLADHGLDGMAQAIEILMNEAMKLERTDVLQAAPYERTDERRGYANGFKPKTVKSRLGRLELQVPQARGVEFYPSTLERGERSERALKLALAEMYVQGVSTRKSRRSPKNSAASTSAAPTSAAPRHSSMKNWRPGETAHWAALPT